MVTWIELKAANPNVFSEAAEAYKTTNEVLGNQATKIESLKKYATGWSGTGSEVLPEVLNSRYELLTKLRNNLTSAASTLTTLAGEIRAAKSELNKALKAVAAAKGKVDATGNVKIPDASDAEAQELADQISGAVKKATTADTTAHTALSGITGQSSIQGSVPVGSIPKLGTNPKDVAKWWKGLTPGQRQGYIMLHPEQVGALDGVSARDRDQANRLTLMKQYNETKIKLDQLAAQGKEDKKLKRIFNALENLKKRTDPKIEGKHGYLNETFLMALDTKGTGKAIVAVGDPDFAENIITYVPGSKTNLGNLKGQINRVDRMVDDAMLNDPSKRTAGIVWLGYEPPQTIGNPASWLKGKDAANPDIAKLAAPDLARFQEGLRATHETPTKAHHTLLGHSYGGTVIGYAALHAKNNDGTPNTPIETDRIVFVGAPGVGAQKASDLGIDPKNVYATVAPDDPISKVGLVPGVTPPTESGFGARRFHSEGGGHSGYWDEKNRFDARRNIAMIATGGNPIDKKYTGKDADPIEKRISAMYGNKPVTKVADGVYRVGDKTIITVRRADGQDKGSFDSKMAKLAQLGKDGKLFRDPNPDERGDAVPNYRREYQAKINATTDPELRRELNQWFKNQDIDHIHELQMGGRDHPSNLWPLDASVNRGSGSQLEKRLKQLGYGDHFEIFVEKP